MLVAHAVLQQYKKLYRKRDPDRGRWEKVRSNPALRACPSWNWMAIKQLGIVCCCVKLCSQRLDVIERA